MLITGPLDPTKIPQRGDGDPTGSVFPRYFGDKYIDDTSDVEWTAMDSTVNGWVKLAKFSDITSGSGAALVGHVELHGFDVDDTDPPTLVPLGQRDNLAQFPNGSTKKIHFKPFRVPVDWDDSTNLGLALILVTTGTSAGNARFTITYSSVANTEAQDGNGTGTSVTEDIAIAPTTSGKMVQHESTTLVLVPANVSSGDIVSMSLAREGGHANDTNSDAITLYTAYVKYTKSSQVSTIPTPATDGFGVGGYTGAVEVSSSQTYSFASNVTAASHGTALANVYRPASASSTTQGHYSGGYNGSYITDVRKFDFATSGTFAAHGTLDGYTSYTACGNSSSTQGFASGGINSGSHSLTCQKWDFSSGTLAVAHGTLPSEFRTYVATSGPNSSTDGFDPGGYNSVAALATILRFDFASISPRVTHGSITAGTWEISANFSSTHGFSTGGYTPPQTNTINKFDMASATGGVDHGDLTVARGVGAGSNSATAGFTHGGSTPTRVNTIDYFLFASNVTAVDHGDISANLDGVSGHQA